MKLYHVTLLKNKKNMMKHGLLALKHTKGIYFTDNMKKSLEWIVTIHDLIFANTQEKYLLVEVDYNDKLFTKWNNTHPWSSLMNHSGDEFYTNKSISSDKLKFYELGYEHDCKKYKYFKNLKNNPIKITKVKKVELQNSETPSKLSWKTMIDISMKHYNFSKGIEYHKDKNTLTYSESIFGGFYKKMPYKEVLYSLKFLKDGKLLGGSEPIINTSNNSKYLTPKNILS